ncbi:MAG: HAD family hydrolase [Candidatus Aenigmatarchaeota archaeon]
MTNNDDIFSDIKAIVFDMDGVLVNSMPFHAIAWQKAFENSGLEVDRKLFYEMEGMNQKRTIEEVLDMLNEDTAPEEVKKIGRKKTELTERNLQIEIFPRTVELLPKIKEKYMLGVVSGSTRQFVDEVIEEYFENCFDVVVAGEDTEESKPSPDPYTRSIEKLDMKKKNILVIENAPLGIESAKRAGLKCVAVATYLPEDKLMGADLVLESHRELVDFLNKGL